MILHGALAYAEVRRNILAGMPSQNQIENLPLAHRQILQMSGCSRAPILRSCGFGSLFKRILDAGDKLFMAERLLDKIGGSGLHGFHGRGHVPVSGDHNRRQHHFIRSESRQQRETIHSRQHRIDHQASFAPGARRGKEVLTTREGFYEPTMSFEKLSNCFPYAGVVVDHEYGRARLPIRRLHHIAVACDGLWPSEETRDFAQEFRRLYRLVEMRAAAHCDGAQGLRRNVAR